MFMLSDQYFSATRVRIMASRAATRKARKQLVSEYLGDVQYLENDYVRGCILPMIARFVFFLLISHCFQRTNCFLKLLWWNCSGREHSPSSGMQFTRHCTSMMLLSSRVIGESVPRLRERFTTMERSGKVLS